MVWFLISMSTDVNQHFVSSNTREREREREGGEREKCYIYIYINIEIKHICRNKSCRDLVMC